MADQASLSDEVRRAKLRAWLDSVFAHFKKSQNWGKLKTISVSGVGRTTVHGWEQNAGPWDRRPTMDRMMKFCTNLGIDPTPPFEIMGWNTSSAGTTNVQDPADTPAIRTIKYKLAHPELDERERYYLEEELGRLAARPLKATPSVQMIHESPSDTARRNNHHGQ